MKGIVLSVIKNNIGIYGFIKTNIKNYYYDSSGLEKGVYMKKGLMVDFDVIKQDDGRDRAVHIKASENFDIIKEEQFIEAVKMDILCALDEATANNGYIAAATLPFILKKLGVETFRKYARSIEEFINLFFSDYYRYIKNYDEGEKCYPGIIARNAWAATNVEYNSDDIQMNLSEGIISKIRDDINEVSEADGFLLAASFPVLLRKHGINSYKLYADNIEDFIERFYSDEFTVLKDVLLLGKRYPGIIVPKSKLEEYQIGTKDIDINEAITYVAERISEAIKKNGFLVLSVLPSLLNERGVDYHKYAENLIDFVHRYFANQYSVKQGFYSNGRMLPDVLVSVDSLYKNEEISDYQSLNNMDEKYRMIKGLYEKKDYVGYLKNLSVIGIDMDNAEFDFVEKAFSSAYYLLYTDDVEFSLNLFQKELLSSRKCIDFVKKWKKSEGYPNTILVNYVQSSICNFDINTDVGRITKLINKVGSDTKINNSFTSVNSRFEECKDSLVFLLYLIRVCAGASHKNTEKVIGEYCDYIKGLKRDNYVQIIDFSLVIFVFEKFLGIIIEYIVNEPLSMGCCTNILSVFVDLNYFARMNRILELICVEENSLLKLCEFLNDHGSWGENEYKLLYSSGISLRIIEKICAHIWENESDSRQLSKNVLRVLAFSLHEGGNAVLDEIVRIHYSQSYTKKQKEIDLVNSFSVVIEELYSEDVWFLLACYIKEYLYSELSLEERTSLDKEAIAELSKWRETSEIYYLDKINKVGNVCEGNEDKYLQLFKLFRGEIEKESELQKKYNEWFGQRHGWYLDLSATEIENLLDEVYVKKAYYSLAFIYEYTIESEIHINSKYLKMYIEALLQMQMFERIIRFVNDCGLLSNDEKEGFIIRAICENFVKYGFSHEALLIFDDDFSIADAIEMLERKLMPKKYSLVLSLIILYAHSGELIKSVYLYTIYHSHAETGYTRNYSQYRSEYGKYFSKLHNHYEVILKAFEVLTYMDLLAFLRWASTIAVPGFSEYNPEGNVFSYYLDELLKDADNILTWKKFIAHLYVHKDIEANQWLLCVATVMAHHVFDAPNLGELHNVFISVLETANRSNWPENLLYYVACYVVDNDDQILCEKLFEAISSSNMVDKMLTGNPWCKISADMDFFVDFCVSKLRETGDLVYFNMLTIIKRDISGRDLVELSSFTVNKVFLLNKICNYFIDSRNQADAIALLSDDSIWRNLTYQENELYNAIKLLYMSNDDIYEWNSKLFSDEVDIDRFKKDLSHILVSYPSQDSLKQFNRICENEAHKLRVYSVVFGVFGNEDIYKEYQYDYEDLLSKGIENEYMAFLKKCYISQLFYNSTYEFFYKLWRYYRLLIILNWYGFNSKADGEVYDIMNRYRNFEMAKRLGYEGFKEALYRFINREGMSDDVRKHVLFSLLKEDFTLLCKNHKETLQAMDDNEISLLRYLTAFIDYRDINQRLFLMFSADIRCRRTSDVFKVAKCLSSSFSNLMDVLSISTDYENDVQLIEEYMSKAASASVHNILGLSDEVYNSKSELYDAILSARQLPFKIFDSIREALIKKRMQFSVERYERLAKHLSSLGYTSAMSQYYHILSLEYAINGDKEGLHSIVSKKGIYDGIPIEWDEETEKLISYSETDSDEKFVPIRAISYIGAGQSKRGRLSFADDLFRVFELDQIDDDNETVIAELYREFCDTDNDVRERLGNGLRVFKYILNHRNYNQNNELPEEHEIAFEVGIIITMKESSVSPDKKIHALIDIFNNCDLTKSQQQVVYERFVGLFKDLSIILWIKYYHDISNIVRAAGDTEGAEEITNLCEQINRLVPGLADVNGCSTESLYKQLKKVNYIGQSVFSIAIMRAVERKKTNIENSIRITVEIENMQFNGKRMVSDGYVYLCVKNIGCTSVNLYQDLEVELFVESMDGVQYTPLQAEVSGIKELRPGWITGCRVDVSKICKDRKYGEFLVAKVNASVQNILVCSTEETIIISEPIELEEIPEPRRNGYYVNLAVGDNEEDKRLYGRDEEKEDIKYAISTGKAVIYGPSRIGKTSLLNWVIHSYAKERRNVITILVGGEDGNGKENDYIRNAKDRILINYDDNHSITEYLLVNMILNGLESKRRNVQFPDELKTGDGHLLIELHDILNQTNKSIVDRYYDIDYVLRNNGYEIWLLFDEFQQVVENWRNVEMQEPDEFIETCNSINERTITNIKLIFCGSDELLRQMVLVESNSVWRRKILESAEPVGIGPIKKVKDGQKDEFVEMIRNDNAVRRPGINYSDAAIETICVYTDRVPLYAKEICNTVLGEIKRICGVEQFGRNVIYSYDISKATQNLMDIQNYALTHSLEEAHKKRIVKIYDAVTKGLDENTDKQYLWLMAKWFMNNPSKVFFNYKEYLKEEGYKLIESESGLRDRLEVSCVRGIIRGNEDTGYMFSTPFYYSAFCGTVHNLRYETILVRELLNEELVDREEWGSVDEPVEISERIIDLWSALAKVDSRNPDKQVATENVRQLIGTTINAKQVNTDSATGNIDEGGNTYNNINIQTIQINQIADSLTGISGLIEDIRNNGVAFNMEEMNARLNGLPKLSLLSSGVEICQDDELAVYDTDSYVGTIEEGVKKSFENNHKFAGMTLDDWVNKNRECLNQIGVGYDEVDYVLSLSERDKNSIIISLYLRCLFDEIVDLASDTNASMLLDYSPVTIMLGKTIERILKEKHLPIYLDNSVWVNEVKTYSENAQYAPSVISFKGISTIGTFTTALFSMFSILDSDPERIEKEENRDNFIEKTGTEQIKWKQYMYTLNKAKKIRNKTGHVEIVTKEDCSTFIGLFLKSKLLKNTIEYIHI